MLFRSEVAVEKAREGKLLRAGSGEPVTVEEVEAVFSDLRRFTEGGLIGG